MNVYLEPLEGKYYGTTIRFGDNSVSLWIFDDTWEPSDRELERWRVTREQWDSNEPVDNGWGGMSPVKSMDYTCDSHFESQYCYEIAKLIRDTLRDYHNEPE